MPLIIDEFCESRCSEGYTFLEGVSEICQYFYIFGPIWINVRTRDAHEMYSSVRGFRENRHSESHILHRRVSEWLSVLSPFIVRFWQNSV
jgi:hypothetical protein